MGSKHELFVDIHNAFDRLGGEYCPVPSVRRSAIRRETVLVDESHGEMRSDVGLLQRSGRLQRLPDTVNNRTGHARLEAFYLRFNIPAW